MKRKFFLGIWLVLTLVHHPFCGTGIQGGGMGFFSMGINHLNLSELNSRLQKAGFATFPEDYFALGGFGQGIVRNIIIGGEGHGLLGEAVNGSGYKNRITGGYGFFNLGYVVMSSGNLLVYPMIGLGGGGISMRFTNTEQSLSFDDVMQNPQRESVLEKGGFMLHLTVGAEYLLNLSDKGNPGGFMVGVRLGYLWMPFSSGWEMHGREISGGPEVTLTGPYIRFFFGMGGFKR